MSALQLILRFAAIIIRNRAVQAAASELGSALLTSAGRSATAAVLRAIRSGRVIND